MAGGTEGNFRWGLLIYRKKFWKWVFSIISIFLLYKSQKDGGPQGYPGPPVPSSLIGVAIVRKKKKLASAVKALHCCNIFRISHKKNLLEQKGNFNSWNERSIQVVSRKNNKSSILVSKVCRYLGRNVSDISKSIGHIHLRPLIEPFCLSFNTYSW